MSNLESVLGTHSLHYTHLPLVAGEVESPVKMELEQDESELNVERKVNCVLQRQVVSASSCSLESSVVLTTTLWSCMLGAPSDAFMRRLPFETGALLDA